MNDLVIFLFLFDWLIELHFPKILHPRWRYEYGEATTITAATIAKQNHLHYYRHHGPMPTTLSSQSGTVVASKEGLGGEGGDLKSGL